MKKTILEIYALAVCFITVICFVVCLGVAGYSLIEIVKPDFTMDSYSYNKFQTNDIYWENYNGCNSCSDENKKKPRPSEDELTKQRQEALSRALMSEQRGGAQSLVKTLIIILIDIVTFFIHWLIAKRARANVTT